MILWTAGAVIACMALGCRALPTNAERTATLSAHGLTATTLPSTHDRVGVLLTGHGFRLTHQVKDLRDSRGRRVHIELFGGGTSNGDPGRNASVTAIDRRGYYLTAAHAVGSDPVWICCGGAIRPARVVFRGDADFDVAVLSVDRPIADAYTWADPAQYPTDGLVLECGPTYPAQPYSVMDLYTGQVSMQLFAGTVRSNVRKSSKDGPYDLVTSNLLARPGDSGGPLMTRDGSLVAIFIRWNLVLTRSYAVRPPPSWVRDVVDQDYIAYRSAVPDTLWPTTAPK